ncbi:MAG TPA: phage holin family protein [Gemmataceae bacterium]|nr:phage holin family protein [Gemmataceae bacterium]
MAENATTEGPGLSSLFRGIFGDLRGLVREEIRLAKAELLKEWGKAKAAAGAMAAGAAVLGVGALLLCLAAVSALHEAARLPWWASDLAVGGAFALVGGGLLYVGRRTAAAVHVIPAHAGRGVSESSEPAATPDTGAASPPSATGGNWGLMGAVVAGAVLEGVLNRRKEPASAAAPEGEGAGAPGFLEKLSAQVGGEFEKIQDQAIAALVALVRAAGPKVIAALADLIEAKVSDAAARLAAAMPPPAGEQRPDAAGPPGQEPTAP